MKTLNLRKTSREELQLNGWSTALLGGRELFIRCNSKGEVNFDKAPVYNWHEVQEESLKRRVCFRVDHKIFKL